MVTSEMLLIPKGFSLNAYASVFKNEMVLSGFRNTTVVLIGSLILNMTLSIIGAYCLSRKNVYWNGFLMKAITATMFFNGGLVPTYLLVARTLKMNDSLLALFLPTAINTFYLIILRTSFSQVPTSLVESARLDGASHWKVLTNVVVPLSLPTIAVILLYYAVERWNSWFPASIYLKSRIKYPLQLILREILINNDTDSMSFYATAADQYSIGETIKYAIVVVSILPILVVYPFLQRYFVKGVMIGAVKG